MVTIIQGLAKEARSGLECKFRADGEPFYCLKDQASDWIKALVHAAHGDMLPDDYRYEFIVNALDHLTDCENPDDARDSIEADCYTSDLTDWLSSHNSRLAYCDDNDYTQSDSSMFTRLQNGQLAERDEVFESVLSSLEERERFLADLPF